jgi:hypothetical protein
MATMVQHPLYEWVEVDVEGANYPEYDGTQNCAQIGVEAFFYSPSEDGEPWFDPNQPRPASMRQQPIPYPTYSKLDTALVQVCHDCPFVRECFAHALVNEEFGFWAGTNEHDRNRLRKKYKVRLSMSDFYKFNDNDVRHLAALFAKQQESVDGVD